MIICGAGGQLCTLALAIPKQTKQKPHNMAHNVNISHFLHVMSHTQAEKNRKEGINWVYAQLKDNLRSSMEKGLEEMLKVESRVAYGAAQYQYHNAKMALRGLEALKVGYIYDLLATSPLGEENLAKHTYHVCSSYVNNSWHFSFDEIARKSYQECVNDYVQHVLSQR